LTISGLFAQNEVGQGLSVIVLSLNGCLEKRSITPSFKDSTMSTAPRMQTMKSRMNAKPVDAKPSVVAVRLLFKKQNARGAAR